jgi:hypothetical protein
MKDMRTAWLVGIALAFVMAGCDEETVETDAGPTPGVDSGPTPGVDSGTPGTDSGTPGTDAGTPPVDAFVPMVDAGPPTCEMGRITLLEDCGGFTACGGDPIGEWCYAEICIEKDELLDQVFEGADGALDDCEAVRDEIIVRSSSGSVSGTISVTATTITRTDVTTDTTATFYLPEECAFGSCTILQFAIEGQLPESNPTCTDDVDNGCECSLTFMTDPVTESNDYTLDGNTIVAGAATGADRRYDFCVADGQLRFRQDPDDGANITEPGIQHVLPSP